MADAELPQPMLGLVVARRDETDNRDAGGCQPGERVTVEPAQICRQDDGSGRATRSCSKQIGKVDAPADDDDAEVLPFERRDQLRLPNCVGDGGEDRNVHVPAGGDAIGKAGDDGPAEAGDDGSAEAGDEGCGAVAPSGTRTRSTEPSCAADTTASTNATGTANTTPDPPDPPRAESVIVAAMVTADKTRRGTGAVSLEFDFGVT